MAGKSKKIVIDLELIPQNNVVIQGIINEIEGAIKRLHEESKKIKDACPHTEMWEGHIGTRLTDGEIEVGQICKNCRKILV